ncbi:hypothetical protein AB9P05_17250 [Roseivirga sp. BDSF3-8]|uniref:hypothetical protein n=1 Tax=Roseivirga sp. BDSF3-8 TaxID=3241598 RepID=UPI0035322790
MTNFQELGPEDTSYLQNKWNTEITELTNDRYVLIDRLNNRVTRQELDLQELNKLKVDLEDAKLLAEFLVQSGASQSMIDKQQVRITELEQEIQTKKTTKRVLTKADIAIEELEIDELANRVQLRQDRLGLLGALENAA